MLIETGTFGNREMLVCGRDMNLPRTVGWMLD